MGVCQRGGMSIFYYLEYKADVPKLSVLAKLELIERLICICLFPSLITILFSNVGFTTVSLVGSNLLHLFKGCNIHRVLL